MKYILPQVEEQSLTSAIQVRKLKLLLVLICGLFLITCAKSGEQPSDARRVTTRTDLVGGPSALGELGDVVLENGKIKVIIQDKGYSRGFGVYGGGIIDADIVRPTTPGNSDGVTGRDSFGELFPVYFLQALNPREVKVMDPSEDGTAQVKVAGRGGEFLSITKVLNRILLNSYEGVDGFDSIAELLPKITGEEGLGALLGDAPRLDFEVLYSLAPGANHVEIATSMINTDDTVVELPSDVANQLFNFPGFSDLARSPFQVPLGFVALFGAGNQVFAPGFGFDIRFALEKRYKIAGEVPEGEKSPLALPALPGLITSGLISINPEGASYGLFYLPEEVQDDDGGSSYPKSFAYNLPDIRSESESFGQNVYELVFGDQVTPADSLIPFSASSFTGMFSAGTPPQLEPNERFTMHHAFFVGEGDVSSIMDSYYKLMNTQVETVVLEVLDEVSGSPVEEASVLIYDQNGRLFNQTFSREAGFARLTLPVGDYQVKVHRGPSLSDFSDLKVEEGGSSARLSAPTPAQLHFDIRGVDNRPLPAKVTVVGTTPSDKAGEPLRTFLFDLEAGQSWRTDDLVPDDPNNPRTRRYVETHGFTQAGVGSVTVPPGDYEVYLSRGTEYELKVLSVSLKAGEEQGITEVLARQVDTPGYVSADFHLHAAPSLDSDLPLRRRVRTAAGEGLEHLVATDHNFITDYRPFIEREGLTEWLSSMIGLELTTLEAGHFNTFPIQRDKSQITRGAFQWSDRSPQELFEQAHAIGDGDTIIQVNHPRDLILGYFSQYGIDPLTGKLPEDDGGSGGGISAILDGLLAPSGPAFFAEDGTSQYSSDFDVIEVLNHGLFHEEFHARMPADIGNATIYDDNGNPLTAEQVAEIPVGEIICDGGQVAYSGAIDDWFNMLNNGETYGGTANSDSHHGDDIGYPRTYVYVGNDDPGQVTHQQVAQGVRAKQMVMSRGPFMEFFVNDEPIGSEVIPSNSTVELKVSVQAPRWIEVNRGVIYANGEVLTRFEVSIDPDTHRFEWSGEFELNQDTWFIAQVRGDRSMFPVSPPIDLPPVLLNEAFGTIAGPLGLGGGPFDEIAPKMTGAFTPLALSNPIWVDLAGDGFDAPGVLPRKCDGYTVVADVQISPLVREDPEEEPIRLWEREEQETLPPLLPSQTRQRKNRHTLTRSFGFPRVRGELNDVRLIFEHFGSHSH